MIEAKLIETTLGSAEKLGIDWTIKVSATGSKRPTTLPWPDEYTGTGKKYLPKIQTPNQLQREATTTYNDAGVAIGTTYTENLYNKLIPGFPAVTADQFVFGTLDFSTFQAVLEVLKSRSSTKIISNPHITTLNNQEAKIFVGTTVSIPTYEYSKETGTQVISCYKDKEVGIKLVVIPNINEKSYITLNIKPNVDGITGFTGPSNQFPMISSRSAETKVMIKDGHTLVIGGLISENRIKSKKGIPILGDIPILDLIFGKREGIIEKTELLIFVTPHIIKEDESLLAETAQLEERLDSGPQEKATVSKKKKKN
jgi:type II secretory pathway component GspD/PulD (secretin)